jgi:hypothetical protein
VTSGGSNQAGSPASTAGATSSGNGFGGASSAGASGAMSSEVGGTGGASSACGYKGQGHVLNVSANVSLCIPPQTCLPETCPPTVGSCVNDQCVFKPGYQGLETLPEACASIRHRAGDCAKRGSKGQPVAL